MIDDLTVLAHRKGAARFRRNEIVLEEAKLVARIGKYSGKVNIANLPQRGNCWYLIASEISYLDVNLLAASPMWLPIRLLTSD